jgi:threonine dehydrogenase-like Zn-dependent dehydrogenase
VAGQNSRKIARPTTCLAERLWSDPGLDLAPLITHRFVLDEFKAAFACAASGQAGKVVFQVSG